MWFQDIKYVLGCKYYRQGTIIAKGNEDVKLYTTGCVFKVGSDTYMF